MKPKIIKTEEIALALSKRSGRKNLQASICTAKKLFLSVFIVVCCGRLSAQTMMFELQYDINNMHHVGLCVMNGEIGMCHIYSDIDDC